jgi:hypothetical protein
VLAAAACTSTEEKCRIAREAAVAEWNGYVTTLESLREQAVAAQSESQSRLTHDVEPRLSLAALRVADGKYNRGDGAWFRAHTIALQDGCKADAECSVLKRTNAEAALAQKDLDERLPLARAALTSVTGPPDAAQTAAKAVILHPEYPQLKEAQQRTAEAAERCRDLPDPKPP